jgi:phage baseplate assembly protein V
MEFSDISNLIMQGKVSEVIGSRVRVVFEDRDNMVSAPLAVLQMYTNSDKSIRMPSLNEDVVCLFLPTGLEAGYVIGSVYVEGNEPPAENNAIRFNDGSSINVKDGVMNINMLSAINLVAPKINLNGAISAGDGSTAQFKGSINSDSDVTASGVSLLGHTNGGQKVDR